MPAFGAALSDDDIWRVLDYLRLQAYGLSGGAACRRCRRRRGAVVPGRSSGLADGSARLPVRVLAQAPGASPEPQDPRLLTVALSRDGAPVADADCVAAGPQAWAAYALAAGLPEDGLAGAQSWWTGAAGCARAGCRARRRPGPAPTTSAAPTAAWRTARPRAWASCWAMDRKPIPIPDIRRAPQAFRCAHAHRS